MSAYSIFTLATETLRVRITRVAMFVPVCQDLLGTARHVKISMNVSTTMKTGVTTMPLVSILMAVTLVNVTKVTKVMEYGAFQLASVLSQVLTVLRTLTVLRGIVTNGNVFVSMDMKVMEMYVTMLMNAKVVVKITYESYAMTHTVCSRCELKFNSCNS